MEKICTSCEESLPLESFYRRSPGVRGNLYSHCKKCHGERYPTKKRVISSEYQEMLDRQDGKCAICGGVDSRALAVDHDHANGRIRGLLCIRCNVGLGMFQDSQERLSEAISYLRENSL